MKKSCYFFLLLASSVAFAQSRPGTTIEQMLFPPGFDIENLTSFGFSNSVKSDLSGLSSANPALITDFKKVSGSLSFSLPSTNRDYLLLGNVGIEKYKPYIPNNFTVMLPFEKYFIAASYNQRYFSQLDFGNIPVTTETQPDGTGETYSPHFYQLVNQYSLVLGMLNENRNLSIGININLNHLIFYEKIFESKMDFEQLKPGFSVGVTYKLNEQYKLSSSYSHKVIYTGMTKFEGPDLLIVAGGSRGGQYYTVKYAEFDINQKIPGKFSVGLLVTESEKLDYFFQYSREFWKGTVDGYSDVHHYSSGLTYGIDETLILSAGFNYLYQKSDPNEIYDGNMSALYLNFGSTFYLDQFNFSASLADSHISNGISSDITSYRRKQTLFKLAVGYAL